MTFLVSVFKRFYCNIHNFNCIENTCIDISDHIYHYNEFINNRFGILVLQQRCKVYSSARWKCLEKPYTIRNVSVFSLLARQAGCKTPTDGTNMRMTVTCITLAGYRNLIFESIRMKFGMNVTKHLLIMPTSFGDNCKILKVQNATSKKSTRTYVLEWTSNCVE